MKKFLKLSLLLLAALAMVFTFAACGEKQEQGQTQAPAQELFDGYKIAWNTDGTSKGSAYKGADGLTMRMSGRDGTYRARFAVDGEQIDLFFPDMASMSLADSYPFCALKYDENNVVTDCKNVLDVTGGILGWNYHIQEVTETEVICNSVGNFKGVPVTIPIDENTKVYDIGGEGLLIGLPGVAAPGGRVYAVLRHDGVASHLFVAGAFQMSPVYWNITRMYDATSKMTTRPRDELGYFVFDFVRNGEVIQIKTMDMDVANQIDSFAAKAMHLRFDEEGNVIEAMHASNATGGGSRASWYHVTDYVAIEKKFTAEKFSGSDKGAYGTFNMTNDCKVYDVSSKAAVMGQETELRIGDQIHCLSNTAGDVCVVFVHNRSMDVDLYYNLERMWNSTSGASTRRADKDGWYHFKMSVNGQHVDLKTQDPNVVYTIDQRAAKVLGLELEGDVIKAAFAPSAVTNRNSTAFDYTTVKSINGSEVVTERNGKTYTAKLSSSCEVYNVSSSAGKVGEKTKVMVGDTVYGLAGLDKKVNEVYVTKRAKDSYLFWNNDRSYNSTTKQTNRKPAADGYYYFEFFNVDKNQNQTFRTNSKAMANKIDSFVAVGLVYEGQDIVEVFKYDQIRGISGGACSWKIVDTITYNKVTAGGETCTISSHMKTYNVSSSAITKGEQTDLRVGDRIHGIKDTRGKVVYMFVVSRPIDVELYYNVERKWDSGAGQTSREMSDDGYYYFTMAVNGSQVELKTDDISIANTIDGRAAKVLGLAIDEDSGQIIKVYLPSNVSGSETTAFDYSKITEIAEDGTVTTMRDGKTYIGKLAADCEIYNVSSTAEMIGEVTTLEINDQLYGFSDKNGAVTEIYVVSRIPKTETRQAFCPVCEADVEWSEWLGASFGDGHYFLTKDVKVTATALIDKETSVCLDLCGHDVLGAESLDRIFNIYGTFNLMDEKKADGTFDGDVVTCYDNSSSTRVGNIFYIQNYAGAEFNMYGGNLKSTGTVSKGKIGGITRIMNIYDGTISGGKATGYGGALRLEAATGELNIYGGTLTAGAGTSAAGGGIIYAASGTVNVHGGKLVGTSVTTNGGVICLDGTNAKGNILGGVIEGGSAKNGGALHVAKGTLTVSGGTIKAGNAANGNCIAMFGGANSKLILSNKVNLAGVFLYTDNMITAQNMSTDSSVTISMEEPGVFMTCANAAEAESLKDCFKSGSHAVSVSGTSLTLGSGGVTPPPAEDHKHCVCGDNVKGVGKHTTCTTVAWTPWTGTVANGGHYYLTKDVSVTSTIAITKDMTVSICLNGHKINGGTSLDRIFNVYGTLNICDHKEGGKYLGEVVSNRTNTSKTGGVFYTQNSATGGYGVVNLYGGTLKATGQMKNGGICGLGNDFNMYDGTLTGGNASNQGGNVYMETNKDSEFNMYGGTISGGKAAGGGGNLRAGNICNLLGGTIEGGTATGSGGNMRINSGTTVIDGTSFIGGTSTEYNGGNIFNDAGNLEFKSGTVSGGKAVCGGNFAIKRAGTVISGGKIYGGTATDLGGDIYFEKDGASITLSGVIDTNGTTLQVHVKLGSVITEALDAAVKIVITEG